MLLSNARPWAAWRIGVVFDAAIVVVIVVIASLGCSADPPRVPHGGTTRVIRSGLDPREAAWCADAGAAACPDLDAGDGGAP